MSVPTLIDLAQISKNPLDTGVMELFLMYSDMLKQIPWKTTGDLKVTSVRLASLPDVGYRALSGGYTASSGHFEQMEETMAIAGGDVWESIHFGDSCPFTIRGGQGTSLRSSAQEVCELALRSVLAAFGDFPYKAFGGQSFLILEVVFYLAPEVERDEYYRFSSDADGVGLVENQRAWHRIKPESVAEREGFEPSIEV